jgi:hypothetical protein
MQSSFPKKKKNNRGKIQGAYSRISQLVGLLLLLLRWWLELSRVSIDIHRRVLLLRWWLELSRVSIDIHRRVLLLRWRRRGGSSIDIHRRVSSINDSSQGISRLRGRSSRLFRRRRADAELDDLGTGRQAIGSGGALGALPVFEAKVADELGILAARG